MGQCRLVVTGTKSDGNRDLAQLGAVVELQRARDRFGGEGVGLLVGAEPGDLGQERRLAPAGRRDRIEQAPESFSQEG